MKFKIRVKDLGWNKIARTVRAMTQNTVLDVGVFGSAAPRQGGGLTNPEIAMVHEFGSPVANIPERSFLRSTMDTNRAKYTKEIQRIATKIFDGKTAYAAMNLLGMRAANDVKNTIRAHVPPPLQPETVARKGSSTPLIDTGQVINSITWKLFQR